MGCDLYRPIGSGVDNLRNTVPSHAGGFCRGWQPCGLPIALLAVQEECSAKNLLALFVAGLGPAARSHLGDLLAVDNAVQRNHRGPFAYLAASASFRSSSAVP
jgi:hypothetical protein